MADKILPTVNFTANPGIDEFEFLHKTYSEEFRNRTAIGSVFGIVDVSGDPAETPFTARPLLVTVSSISPLTIDISAGQAITASNMLITIDSAIPSIPLPDIAADRVYVVAIEYNLVDASVYRVGRFGTPVAIRRERPANIPPGGGASTLLSAITVASIDDFNNASLFSSERKEGMIVLGVVTVRSDAVTAELRLSVDLTRETYSFNRPWFTVVDIEHRSKIGSGVISDKNPHGTELQDLSSAGLTLYQQQKDLGGVIAKDYIYHGYPGTLCSELITLGRIEIDSTGEVTTPEGEPLLGGTYFVRLAKLPVRMGSLYFSGTPWNPIPYRWIEGTRILVLGPLEDPRTYPADGLICEYFSVDALAVLPESPTQGLQTFEVIPPLEGKEFIVSEGLSLDVLAQTTISLPAVLGPIKRNYKVLCDGDGALVLSPQPMVSIIKVASALVGAPPLTINQSPHGGRGVRLTLGLTRASERTIVGASAYDLDLRVRVIGLDQNGGTVQEDLSWKASQWRDQPAQAGFLSETPEQFRTTRNKFSFVKSVSLTNTISLPDNAGPDAILSLWAEVLDSEITTELCNVASFFWTGTTGLRLRDERTIGTTLAAVDQKRSRNAKAIPEDDLQFSKELFDTILDPSLTNPSAALIRMALEKDDDRVYGETFAEFSETDSTGSIILSTVAAVVPGEILRIGQGKYLRTVTSGANTAIGEFNIGSTDVVFKNNLIQTINDPNFDSGWFAVLGTGAVPPVTLTRTAAYPEGFSTNVRKIITFTGSFTSGSFTVTVEGQVIGPIAYAGSNDATLIAIRDAINTQTSIRARTFGSSPFTTLILLGDGDGTDFSVTTPVSTGGAPAAVIQAAAVALSFAQPSGGSLSLDHLPQRYRESAKPWAYISRPILWSSLGWQGRIEINADNPGLISNLDTFEVAPGRLVTAKRGALITVDPAVGEFLVDVSSLPNTLSNMANTINHASFRSGVFASVSGNGVDVRVAGFASALIELRAESVPGTWLLSSYQPVGGGSLEANAILRAVHPIASMEWRYQEASASRVWSPWSSFDSISERTGKINHGASLYAIQVRLRGRSADPNSFALYRYTPTVSASTLPAVESRVTDIETELDAARGSLVSVDARISSVVDLAGVRIQDTELTGARNSSTASVASNLRERLDAAEAASNWLVGPMMTSTVLAPITQLQQPGEVSQLLRGPVDGQGNSDFMSNLGSSLFIGGTNSIPLQLSLNGYSLSYPRTLSIDFSAQAANTYFIYVEAGLGEEAGVTMVSSSTPAMGVNANVITDLSANFLASGVKAGHVLEIESLKFLGTQPFHSVIKNVISATQVQIEGTIPSPLSLGTPYRIVSTRELQPKFTATKIESAARLYIGQVTWSGTSFSSVRPYRYLDKYTSAIVSVTASTSYTLSFEHNLGRLPGQFTLYFRTSLSDTEPKVLQIGDEAVVKVSTTTLTVRNRFDSFVARDFAGTAFTTGFLQLVIG